VRNPRLCIPSRALAAGLVPTAPNADVVAQLTAMVAKIAKELCLKFNMFILRKLMGWLLNVENFPT
jgi:hypothetical protein